MSLVERLTKRSDISPGDLSYLIHATTTATNAVIRGRGARAGLLVTEGFRACSRSAARFATSSTTCRPRSPKPLIPRQRCHEIPERLRLPRSDARRNSTKTRSPQAVSSLRADNVESIAVCFLHSYQNPAHERRAAAIIRGLHPEIAVSLSSDIAPEIREYWRASTAVINAYIAPVIRRYLESLQTRLARHGSAVQAPHHAVQWRDHDLGNSHGSARCTWSNPVRRPASRRPRTSRVSWISVT